MEPEFLKNTEKKLPFQIPEGYFEKLQRDISGKVRRAAQEAPAPRVQEEPGLPVAASGTVFHVPDGYFDSLPGRIHLQLHGQGGTAHTAWYKTAIAACLTLLLGTLGVIQVEKMNEPEYSIANIRNFDEEILVQEYLESWASAPEEQPGEIETYLLNQVDEGLLIQEL